MIERPIIEERHHTVKEEIDRLYIRAVELSGVIENDLQRKNISSAINDFNLFYPNFASLFKLTRSEKNLIEVRKKGAEKTLCDAIEEWMMEIITGGLVRKDGGTIKRLLKGLSLFNEFVDALNNCGIVTRKGR